LKKCFIFLCVLVLLAGIAVAEDIGLTVGVDFSVDNVTNANDGKMGPILMPSIAYDTHFLDDALNFTTELDYYFDLTPDFKDLAQYLDLDLTLGYTLNLGRASTLLLEADNLFEGFKISPRSDDITGTFTPSIKFTQNTDIGGTYVKVSTPICYIGGKGILLRSRLGWDSTFGLGIWAQLDSSLDPSKLYQGLRANVSYGADSFDFDVTARVYNDLDDGIEIKPNVNIYIGAFNFNAYCTFGGVAAKGGDVTISPGVGIYFNF